MTSTAQLGFEFDPAPRKKSPQVASERIGDITAGRHRGNVHSAEAHARNRPYQQNMRDRIRAWVVGCGFHGATLKEVAAQFGKQLNQISGRFSQLKADELIFDSGREREGCTVWVSQKQWCNGSERARS